MLGRSSGSNSQQEVQRFHHLSLIRVGRSGFLPSKMWIMSPFLGAMCEKGTSPVNSSYGRGGCMKDSKALERHTSAVIANAHTSRSAVALPPSIPSGAIQGRAPTMGEVRGISNEGLEMNRHSNPVSNARPSPATVTLH